MLRGLVGVAALGFLALGLFLTLEDPAGWPVLAMAALVVAGTIFERFYYRGAGDGAVPGPGWEATPERFRDEETGRLVTVWFNRATGERRYIDAE
jgi:hypothetical protein